MSTKYIASNWRLPNQENSSKSDNYGLTFDGSVEKITFDPIALSTDCTLSAWAKRGSTANMFLFGNTATYGYGVYFNGTANLYIKGTGASLTTFNNAAIQTALARTDWVHWLFIKDNTAGTTSVYVDGNLAQSVSHTNAINEISSIGGSGLSTGTQYIWDGSISEVAVFDYALSSTQISTLYGSSSLGAGNPMALKPQPVAFYPLGDNSASNPLTQPNEAVEDASVFSFDGSNDFIDCGIPSFLNSTSLFTSSLWFNTNDVGTQTTLWANGSSASQLWVISKYQDDLIIYGGTSTKYYRKNNLFSINTWYNLIVVYDGSQANADRFKVYLNGDLLTGATINGTIETITPTFTTNLNIGRIGYAAASYFNGEISNVVFWNSDQTTEISNIYNSGVPATLYTNTPTAWYKLDQSANWDVSGSGNWTIPDASGNGNDGTSSGMTSANLVLSDLSKSIPYDSYSFELDGVSGQNINVGTISSLNSASAFTISFWAKLSTPQSNDGVIFTNRVDNNNRITIYRYSSSIYFHINSSGSNQGNVSAPAVNTWTHISMVFDGSGAANADRLKVYYNGVEQTLSYGGTIPATTGTYSTSYIGSRGDGTNEYNGLINNFTIFNQALTSTEVMKLYANGVPQDLSSFSPAPQNWYTLGSNSFWNGSNYICRDLIGSNDGTSANAGVDAVVGDSPRSSANGIGTNMDIESNIVLSTKWSENNSISINMSSEARVTDVP